MWCGRVHGKYDENSPPTLLLLPCSTQALMLCTRDFLLPAEVEVVTQSDPEPIKGE